MMPPPPRSTLFPYTTLFRSRHTRKVVEIVGDDARCVNDVFGEQRSEEHTSELQSQSNLVCRLLLEKKKQKALPIRTCRSVASRSTKASTNSWSRMLPMMMLS